MARYRKKPVEIEAIQWDGDEATVDVIFHWEIDPATSIALNGEHLHIATLEGDMRADVGDWIIRGVKGELYPCKPDIFAATYDPV